MRTILRATLFGVASLLGAVALPNTAAACGGFFCNQNQPVNQAAEGIIFADNGDGTVTAVIQIKYQGPSESFSWLLPISSVPKADSDIGVASDIAFQRLQAATNPNYQLNIRVEGTCKQGDFSVGQPSAGSAGASASGGAGNGGPIVNVEASGVVGSFDWTVISVDKSTADPADAAAAWLTSNGYDVPSGSRALLGPYLEEGLYLLALKLVKGADTGSIRPIALTYRGTQPSIPVKLTAVAANDDMGVLAWVLGKSRAIPKNYYSLELNEARINWFNANSNYNQVVIDAANDAGGQGFVTEYAGSTKGLEDAIWQPFEEQRWTTIQKTVYPSLSQLFNDLYGSYGSFDGFWEATKAAVTLPATLPFEDFKACPTCYQDQVTFSPSAYFAELEKSVIQPMKLVRDLVAAHPELTRLYTTLSAEEMTLDPLFSFNADLPDVSNQHTAERVIECNPKVYQFDAPWRIELPQGGVIRGQGAAGVWPDALAALPPNLSIARAAESGAGKVVEDNTGMISAALAAYNEAFPAAAGSGNPGTIGRPGSTGSGNGASPTPGGGGCNVGGGTSPAAGVAALLGLAALFGRRRRK